MSLSVPSTSNNLLTNKHAASRSCSVPDLFAAPRGGARSGSVRVPRSRSVRERRAAPRWRSVPLRGCSVVAPWSLRGRSMIAPWLLRGRSGPALCALRLQGPRRATGMHPAPLPAPATACMRHALPWPWPWALPVGTAAADTANCTVAAVCARSTAWGMLTICMQADVQTAFAVLKQCLHCFGMQTVQTVFAMRCR